MEVSRMIELAAAGKFEYGALSAPKVRRCTTQLLARFPPMRKINVIVEITTIAKGRSSNTVAIKIIEISGARSRIV